MPEVNGRERLELTSSDEPGTPARGEPQTFYRYEGKGGKVVIVDSLSKLPPEAREHAERLDLGPRTPAPSAEPAATGATVQELIRAAVSSSAAKLEPTPPAKSATVVEGANKGGGGRFEFEPTSFGLGLGSGLLLALALMFFSGRSDAGGAVQRWIVRAALFAGVVLLGTSAYLGWSRQRAGLGEAALASPQDLIQDARGAVDQVQQRRAEQERQLEEIKHLAK